MHHRVHAVERVGVEQVVGGVPLEVEGDVACRAPPARPRARRFRLAALLPHAVPADPAHGVAARGEERRQRRADQPRRPRDRDRHGGLPGELRVPRKIVGRDCVPVAEEPREVVGHVSPRDHVADGAGRERVVDLVVQDARAVGAVLEPVQVLPARERPAHLHVAKLLPFAIVTVLQLPAHAREADAHLEHDPRAVLDPADPFDHGDRYRGRREPFEGSLALVPRKERGTRDGHR